MTSFQYDPPLDCSINQRHLSPLSQRPPTSLRPLNFMASVTYITLTTLYLGINVQCSTSTILAPDPRVPHDPRRTAQLRLEKHGCGFLNISYSSKVVDVFAYEGYTFIDVS